MDAANFVSQIRFNLSSSASFYNEDVWDRSRCGMMSRHMCAELGGICNHPESYGIRLSAENHADRGFKDTSRYVLEACRKMGGALIAAGGSVLAMLERESGHTYVLLDPSTGAVVGRSVFASSDVDFYVRAHTPEGRRAVVAQLLSEVMPPVGKVVRTQFAISWEAKLSDVYGPKHPFVDGTAVFWHHKGSGPDAPKVVKVQVINKTLPRTPLDVAADVDRIFETYDLDCCKWALDDKGLYGTRRSLDALFSRICRISPEKITDSLVPRMARYLKRCYDFEIEQDFRTTPPDVRLSYPTACAEVVGMLRSGNASHAAKELPLSGYDVAFISERDRDVMWAQMKRHGSCGDVPHAICARYDEAWALVYAGSQKACIGYWNDWKMKTMGRMCESVTWMALASQRDREEMQETCLRSLAAWEAVVGALDLLPMFDTVPPFNKSTPAVYDKYWLPKGQIKPTIFVI